MELFQTFYIEYILAGATFLFFIIQLLYWVIVFPRPLQAAREETKEKAMQGIQHPVSVVVYAKNESENLDKLLPSLLTQDYPVYEVIVINDGSTDESDQVLKYYEQEYTHLYHTYIPEDAKYLSRKKLALTVGIKAAKYDILLFTEANCHPLGDQWITRMAEAYRKPATDIVLGYCAYGNHKGFLHKLIAYDNLLSGLQYLSSALVGQPYTGNGRNLSYRKEIFFQHKGYYKSLNLHAGDDDLFVNEVATPQNTRVQYTAESITEMTRIDQFKVWKEMKVSRAATRRFYEGKRLTFFRIETASYVLFIASGIASFIMALTQNWIGLIGPVLYIALYCIKIPVLRKSAQMLQQKPLTVWLPLLDLILPVFNFYVRIYRMMRGKNDFTCRLPK